MDTQFWMQTAVRAAGMALGALTVVAIFYLWHRIKYPQFVCPECRTRRYEFQRSRADEAICTSCGLDPSDRARFAHDRPPYAMTNMSEVYALRARNKELERLLAEAKVIVARADAALAMALASDPTPRDPDRFCAWPLCTKEPFCASGNFGGLTVCREHFMITNGAGVS